MSALSHSLPTGCIQGRNLEYVISGHRYDIFEDFGPFFFFTTTPLAFVLFHAWPVVIGTVSFFYCGGYSSFSSALWYRGLLVSVMAICAFYKRRRNHMQLISSADRGRYIRLMAISSIDMLGTIPLGTFYIVSSAKGGVIPWKSWAHVHSHYSEVVQVAGFIWKNIHVASVNLEMFRWSLVACSFIFFALFGFSCEAREHYYRLYQLLARSIGKSTSTPHAVPTACVVHLPCWPVLIHLGSRHSFFAVLPRSLM